MKNSSLMKDTKLIKIFKTLTTSELGEFEKFIANPYFTKGRNLTTYLKELKKFYPSFTSDNVNKEFFYLKLHKGGTFDKKANELMNTMNSVMQKMLDKFVVMKTLEKNRTREMLLLCEGYTERGLNSLGLDLAEKTIDELLRQGITNDDVFMFEQKLIALKAENYVSSGNVKSFHNSYMQFTDSVMMYVLMFFLNDYPRRKNYNIGSNVKFELPPISEILINTDLKQMIDDLSKRNPVYKPILEVYYSLYLCYREPENSDLYKNFRDSVFRNFNSFTHSEKFNLLTYLNTLCNIAERFYSKNRSEFVYEVSMKMLETGAYGIRQNEMEYTLYNNIVMNLLTLKKFDEAEKFIHNYVNKLQTEVRSRYKSMALARLYFEKKEYRKTIDVLSTIPDLALNRISIAQLKLLSLYELREYETAINQAEALKKYLKENKTISKELREQYFGFASAVKVLIEYHLKTSSDHAHKINTLILKYPTTFKKEWLLKKVDEIESNLSPKIHKKS